MTPPVFAHGRLRLYLLSLLAEEPRHGYELIQALSDRFGGTYSPSAGTIYPRLAKLEDDGLVTKTTEGRKTVYAITDAGRAELARREGDLDSIENEVTDSVRRLADEVRAGVNQAMKSMKADLAAAARQAKQEARTTGTTTNVTVDTRLGATQALSDAELVLSEFRQQMRTELRSHAARHALPEATANQLRTQLAQVRADILRTLD